MVTPTSCAVLYFSLVRLIVRIVVLAPVVLIHGRAAYAQAPGKGEFEVASVKINAPQAGFHFAADAVSGGPGTADPGMFRCSKCSLATLIVKAFDLQPYQFPGRTSLTENTYDVLAKIPTGATGEEFSAMLQNLLKDRFGLTWHFQEKKMKGYHLVVAKNGPKLTESTGASMAAAGDQHRSGPGESHNHSGAVVFGSSASYRAVNRTTADLARVLSDQMSLPVDDETGLTGKYDISLRWSGAATTASRNHADGAFSGVGHSHDGGGGGPYGQAADPSGPTLFDALQEQLGLRLVPADQALARLFVVDKVALRPTDN
jgi:uncharacterized protein (TIGR03435 family)